ncbi:ester cyclase [Sneathiella marina]|uniref:Ester cyclase n=1 Tax=Sneathiella marina TaxID=2950108 RepID=A0ABY4WA27_9PROT|nr:ester cyclase [Sneathiella marina]USG62762.1 ester cyclase [Sneathiella marina]
MTLTLSPTRLIERFYHELWNKADEAVAHDILHADFRFRGSLGPERRGPDGFLDYLRSVRLSLPDFMCRIQEIVTEGEQAVARMEFVGTQDGVFYATPPTHKKITWAGAAFFKTNGTQITDLWVLGDIDAIKQQLGIGSPTDFA